jgi:hypothetical protein
MQHLQFPKNALCLLNFRQRLRELSPSSSDVSTPGPPNKRQKTDSASTTTESDFSTTGNPQRGLQFGTPVRDEVHDAHDDDNFAPFAQDDYVNQAPPVANPPPQNAHPPQNPQTQAQNQLNQTQNGEHFSRMNNNFATYVEESRKHRNILDIDTQAAIELLAILQKHGALSLYDDVCKWHIQYIEAKKKPKPRHKIYAYLRKRYNLEACQPTISTVLLPNAGVVARIPCHDASAMITDLLTDPNLKQEDYLWFNHDPLGEPPEEWMELRDINDGLAYRGTYEELILPQPYTDSGRRRVLLPIITYMDSCVTGGNDNLPIEFVQFTLGILNSAARSKEHAWRKLGAMPQVHKVKTKAQQELGRSGHVEAKDYLSASESEGEDGASDVRKFRGEFEFGDYIDSSDSEDEMCDVAVPETALQDFHVILQVILSSLKKIIDPGGFEWDHCHNGETVRLFYVPFIMFIKGDTVEHDKLCGHYGTKTGNVKQLCRYCVCPNQNTDDPYADFPRRTVQSIKELVRKKDLEGLQAQSQHLIFNAYYELSFGTLRLLGVHSACPLELLHWIQLGHYKYDRLVFIERVGDNTQLANKINTICAQFGSTFARQSDRSYPRTKFVKGFKQSKLHAHEMTGMILVLVATLRSFEGRNALIESRNEHFPHREAVMNWIAMLELHLQFEAWLKSTKMDVSVVIRARTKVRELMAITKAVGNRQDGMGYRTNNFHATKHVPDDILLFGPPHCVNTSPDESRHRSDKKAAKSTQKRHDTFDIQCARRVEDRRAVQFGVLELQGRPKWDYFDAFENPDRLRGANFQPNGSPKKVNDNPYLTGVRSVFWYDEEKEGYVYKVQSSMKRKSRFQYPPHIVNFLSDLAEEFVPIGFQQLIVHSELQVPLTKYRAAPFYKGRSWYDWAMCRIGEEIEGFVQPVVPVQIRGFVDLRQLPADNPTNYVPGIYMVTEPTRLTPEANEINMSDLFVPYMKDEGTIGPNRIELLSIDRIVQPACVVPDVGHTNKRAFLRVRPVSEWASWFERWVNSPIATPHQEPPVL